MLKQSVSRIKKVLPVLLGVLFVVSLTAVSASAHNYYRGGYGYGLSRGAQYDPQHDRRRHDHLEPSRGRHRGILAQGAAGGR